MKFNKGLDSHEKDGKPFSTRDSLDNRIKRVHAYNCIGLHERPLPVSALMLKVHDTTY